MTGFFQQKPSKAESFSATVREAEETQEAHARRMQYGVGSPLLNEHIVLCMYGHTAAISLVMNIVRQPLRLSVMRTTSHADARLQYSTRLHTLSSAPSVASNVAVLIA